VTEDILGEQIGQILLKHYQTEQSFVSAYSLNPKKVLHTVVIGMKTVPIDLTSRLEATYKKFTTFSSDQYTA
jgi:hypothetical protein